MNKQTKTKEQTHKYEEQTWLPVGAGEGQNRGRGIKRYQFQL